MPLAMTQERIPVLLPGPRVTLYRIEGYRALIYGDPIYVGTPCINASLPASGPPYPPPVGSAGRALRGEFGWIRADGIYASAFDNVSREQAQMWKLEEEMWSQWRRYIDLNIEMWSQRQEHQRDEVWRHELRWQRPESGPDSDVEDR